MDFNVYSPNSNPFFEMTLQLWVFINPQAFLLFFFIILQSIWVVFEKVFSSLNLISNKIRERVLVLTFLMENYSSNFELLSS